MNPFVRPHRSDDPEMRLFGFHHAGGSAAAYYPMIRELPQSWELLLLDLPGRGKRHGQQPLEHMDQVVRRAVADMEPWLDGRPVALFGHSFGALVALEVGRVLESMGRTPLWLGVSGRVPPSVRRVPKLSELNDEQLLRALVTMGGTPERLGDIPEFRDRFLGITRADLRAAESYEPDPGRTPLSCPLTVFCGTDDAWAPLSTMSGWAAETATGMRQRVYSGGHFYFQGRRELKRLTHDLVDEIQAVAPVTAEG
ncbi:thioesterase II family protein [Streptomyces sp. NPDC016845]|uniref:thioesterase II family protein n=1 Tax=Streptomyces sp. NPDC016845 TaxID=3364972 RepID=UPI0037B42033